MTEEKNQLSFDFFEDINPESEQESSGSAEGKIIPPEPVEIKEAETAADTEVSVVTHKEVRQALAAWVLKLEPTGIGFKVPARFTKFQADIAAFWSSPTGRYLKPVRTAVIEIRRGREECWPECSNRDQLLPKLRELKEKRERLRDEIRQNEPELRRDDNLFEEYVDWDYDLSNNRPYHRCMRQIRETEKALYNGSRFEMIRRTGVANLLYLAVPEGSVAPDEIADGWGLIYWNDKLEINIVRQADSITCMEKARLHLIQKIAESNMSDFMHANGLRQLPDGRFGLTSTPRKRKYVVKSLKNIRFLIEYIPVILIVKALRMLPFKSLKYLCHSIGALMYVMPSVGRLTAANVKAAFPEKSKAECSGIARRSLGNLILSFAEFIWMADDIDRIGKYAHMHNADMINEHADKGESILFVTPHFGNWEIAGLLMTHFTRMNFVVIAKKIRNPYLNNLINGCRETGNKVVYSKGAVREVMKAMKQGFGLGSLIDQNTRIRDGGVFVDFFGLPVPVSRMPATLGKRPGNAPYFGGVYRDPETGHLHSYMKSLPKAIEEYDSDEKIIGDFMKLTEEMIRQYPDQYLWFYKRYQNIPRDASPELIAKYPYYSKVATDRFYDNNAPKP